jgi:hypothetical protein
MRLVESYTETYVDPISGMVTTVQRKRAKAPGAPASNKQTESTASPKLDAKTIATNNQVSSRPGSDLSARLAAVMSEKSSRASSPSPSGASTPKLKPKAGSKQTPETEPTTQTSDEKTDDITDVVEDSTILSKQNDEEPQKFSQMEELTEEPVKKADDAATDSTSISQEANGPANTESEQKEDEESLLSAMRDDAGDDVSESPQIAQVKKDVNGSSEAAQSGKVTEEPQPLELTAEKVEDDTIFEADQIQETELIDSTSIVPTNDDEKAVETSSDTSQPLSQLVGNSVTDDSEKWNAIIRQREDQVLSVMKSNAELHEQLQQLQESSDMEIAKLKAKVDDLMSSKTGNKLVDDLRTQLAAKDTQIQGLMAEGEALSKRELKHMNALKKLRAEKQESEKNLQDLQKKVEKGSADLVEANVKVVRMTESEKKANGKRSMCCLVLLVWCLTFFVLSIESMKNATATASKQQKMITKLEKSLEDTRNELKESQVRNQISQIFESSFLTDAPRQRFK